MRYSEIKAAQFVCFGLCPKWSTFFWLTAYTLIASKNCASKLYEILFNKSRLTNFFWTQPKEMKKNFCLTAYSSIVSEIAYNGYIKYNTVKTALWPKVINFLSLFQLDLFQIALGWTSAWSWCSTHSTMESWPGTSLKSVPRKWFRRSG